MSIFRDAISRLIAPRRRLPSSAVKNPYSFDRHSYLAVNPDVEATGIDLWEHYVICGTAKRQQLILSALEEAIGFDRAWYLATYPDVAASRADPFKHYCAIGRTEGRHINKHLSFSPQQLAVLAKSYHLAARAAPQDTIQDSSRLKEGGDNRFDSAKYWSERYRSGGNSGAGSYGRLAAFKAEIINAFVREHNIASVIEFGCGDGAQLALADYPTYLGFDVADDSIDRCRSKFAQDVSKEFRNAAAWDYERADLVLSLDVIYHLIEDAVFHDYMCRLFASAKRYVIVYSSNDEGKQPAAHVKHRRFTDWISIYHADFKLVRYIPNRWPLADDGQSQSFADFFIFEKIPTRKHTLPGHLVVSLTSYAKRFPTLELTLRRVLQQSVQPDETVLWVSLEDRELLPAGVLALQRHGLTIRTTPDICSYKKIIPALEHYPESFVITLDDDLAYPLDVIEPLVTHYQNPDEVLCRRAHRVTLDEKCNPLPYNQWCFEIVEEDGGPGIFATGGAGALYPPHSLAPEVRDESIFATLAPLADDVWLFWMEWLAGTKVRRVGPRYRLQPWPGCQEQGLWVTHNSIGGNDRVIAALTARYGSPFGARNAQPNGSSES